MNDPHRDTRCIYTLYPGRPVRASPVWRPTLETMKTIISVSLDMIRTYLAVMSSVQDWGSSPAAA
jgi:hypothetical protein